MVRREAAIVEGVGLPGRLAQPHVPGASQPGRAFVLSCCLKSTLSKGWKMVVLSHLQERRFSHNSLSGKAFSSLLSPLAERGGWLLSLVFCGKSLFPALRLDLAGPVAKEKGHCQSSLPYDLLRLLSKEIKLVYSHKYRILQYLNLIQNWIKTAGQSSPMPCGWQKQFRFLLT